jgi:hypothetical protein
VGQALPPANPALDECQARGFAARPGADWVVLDTVRDAVQFRFVADTTGEGFILPEGLPRSAQDQVGLSRGEPFNQRVIAGSEVLGSSTTGRWLGMITQARSR